MSQFTESDVGKTVVNPVGEDVGIVEAVEDGVAYVDPHPDWTDRVEAGLGWNDDPGANQAPLEDRQVENVTDDRVTLREDLHVDRSGNE